MNPKNLEAVLEKRHQLAKGSKLGRLLFSPKAYISAIYFQKFVYPKKKKGRLATASTFWGQEIQILLPAGMDIFLLGCKTHDSEIRLTKFLLKKLPQEALFIDAGAHFGFYSLLAAHLLGEQSKVISIEASQSIFKILQKNVANSSQIELIHAALSKQEGGFIQFTEFPILYSEYNTLHQEQFEEQDWYKKNPPQKIQVPAQRLDQILAQYAAHEYPEVFIKIDVEGAEFEVIQGLSKQLDSALKDKLYIVMEFWSGEENQTQDQHRQAVEHLQESGFKAYQIKQEGDLTEIKDFSKLQKSENIVFKVSNY